jgi:hypothetical protein
MLDLVFGLKLEHASDSRTVNYRSNSAMHNGVSATVSRTHGDFCTTQATWLSAFTMVADLATTAEPGVFSSSKEYLACRNLLS